MAKVTVIPATIEQHSGLPVGKKVLRKVAGYARVSTDHEEQTSSYAAQVDYYTSYIRSNPDWQFVGVYTDEGISALSTKNRDGFNSMINDALSGKIDLIVTKSVSRFARNTVDSLSTIRKLKENGVEVYFEKENIWSFDGKGELLLTIMSSLAQEESRSISANVTWGQRKRFSDGKVSLAYSSFLGYKKGDDGKMEIVPDEAAIVRDIYKMFISGKSLNMIAKHLTAKGIPTPRGNSVWRVSTIESILTNEKYKGDAILQKTFTVDFLNKKLKVNEGEVPQYYVTDSHEGIIDKAEWDQVQVEMHRRKQKGKHHTSLSPFSSRIVCGDCGAYYGSKVWHSTDKYKRTIWQCNCKFKGDHKCTTPHLYEDTIKKLFVSAVAKLMDNRDTLLDDCYTMQTFLENDVADIDKQIAALDSTMSEIRILAENLISENARCPMDQDDYNKRYDEYVARFKDAEDKQEALKHQRVTKVFEADIIECFTTEVRILPGLPVDFSEEYWNALIDHVTVYSDERVVFTFKNGTEIEEIL